MDIPALSMRLAQTDLLSDVGTAMLAKCMDQADTVSASLAEMIDSAAMEHSVSPELGGNIDIRI